MSIADFRYDYPSAIEDRVIRVVRFQHDRGVVRRISAEGVEEEAELRSDGGDLSDTAEADKKLRDLLIYGGFTDTLLKNAHEKLLECRKTMSSAGGLVLCIDQNHAEQIAKKLTLITGQKPDLVVSDDDRATSTVHEFRESGRLWVVAVKQISEGVDIKRLMVLAYLTTTRTELFFRQAVGRIVRYMGTDDDMEAYCFMPDHPTLVRCAQNIVNAQAQAIMDEDIVCGPGGTRPTGPQIKLWPTVIGTEHTGSAGSIIEGECLTQDQSLMVQQAAHEERVSEKTVWRLWQRWQSTTQQIVPPLAGIRSRMKPLEDQEDTLRAALRRVCSQAAFRLFDPDPPNFPYVQQLVNQHIGKQRAAFTMDDCRNAIAFVAALQKSPS
jgi:hypothetical protein